MISDASITSAALISVGVDRFTPTAARQEWFTTVEAAEFLRFSPRWVKSRIASGELTVHRWGRSVRISRASLLALLQSPA